MSTTPAPASRSRGWRLAGALVALALIVGLIWSITRGDETSSRATVLHRPRPHGLVKADRAGALAGEISGWVVDPEGGGVRGATITAMRQRSRGVTNPPVVVRSARSSLDGSFRIGRLTPGLYTVAASAPGFTTALRTQVEIDPEGPPPDLTLRLWRGGVTLSGRVLDAGGGTIPGALVSARGYDATASGTHEPRLFQAEANRDGKYLLQLPPGGHELSAKADGYVAAIASIHLGEETTRDFLLQPAARISGRAVMASDRQPVAGARVQVLPADRTWDASIEAVITDDQGTFRINTIPPGTFRVAARKEELVGSLGPLALAEVDTVDDVELVMAPGLTLEGVVTTKAGQPLPHARIGLAPAQNVSVTIAASMGPFADEAGRYVVDGIVAGDYRVQVRAHGFSLHEENLSITRPTKRNFALLPASVVTGVVLSAAGLPVPRAQVEAAVARGGGKGGSWSPGRTDREGRFRFGDLGAGELRVTARHRSEAGRFGPEPLDAGSRKEITVRLAPGAQISGTVLRDDGAPAAGARVMVVESLHLGARTDADGKFTVDGLPAGDTTLWARAADRDQRWSDGLPDAITVKLEAGEHKAGVQLVVPGR